MSSIIRNFVLVTLTSLVLGGCVATPSSTSIIPLGDGGYDMISTAETEDVAYKNAEKSATLKCQEMGKEFIAVSHKSVYQGVSKTKKQEIAVTDVAMAWVTGNTHKGDRSDDYKITMKFNCK